MAAFFSDTRPDARESYPALNLLRLAAASMVFVAHVWQITGRIENWNIFLGRLGVDIFFIISGFLIARSWQTSNNLARYALSRALRIFPALCVVVLFATLVIGPAFTSLPLKAYFSSALTYRYLLNSVLITQYPLPGVFTHNPHGNSVNNPLWTLPYEACLYGVIAMIGLGVGRFFRPAMLVIFFVVLVLNLFDAANWLGADDYRLAMNALEFSAYFFAGSLVWVFSRTFVFRWYLALAAVLVLVFRAEIGVDGVIWFIALPYSVLWLGLRELPGWRWIQHFRHNDYSYGLYIWGSPIQQSVVALIGPASLLAHFFLSSIPTSFAAYCSWHLVEKRCLALKSTLPAPRRPADARTAAATEPG